MTTPCRCSSAMLAPRMTPPIKPSCSHQLAIQKAQHALCCTANLRVN
jgi:hypothetical protein